MCVFVCAACGLVYELELVATASYLIGDSVTQASVVLSVMVFAMGVGSLAAKRLRWHAAAGFGAIEAALALIGGCSAMALHAVFAWTGEWGGLWASGPSCVLVAFSLAIGVLIGAEVPLLMELIQRVRRQDAGGAVADLFAADYVGALVGGLAFPFLLLPWLGQLTGALVTGAVNALVGAALVFGLFRGDLRRRCRWCLALGYVLVLGLLASAAVLVDDFEQAARQAVYGADIRVGTGTGAQEIVLTGGTHGRPLALFLGGRLRFTDRDERRHHEALVHPAMNGPHARVLVLGDGEGLATREVLRYPDVRRVDVAGAGPGVVRLARSDPALAALNGHAYQDPRVRVRAADAFAWLRGAPPAAYDVVVASLPDPRITANAKLYSQEFYGMVREALAPGGRLAVYAGPMESRPRVFWTVDATVRACGLRTTPYRVDGRVSAFVAGPDRTAGTHPVPRDWGFVLASADGTRPRPGMSETLPGGPRALTRDALTAGVRRAGALRVRGLPPSTLVHPRYTD